MWQSSVKRKTKERKKNETFSKEKRTRIKKKKKKEEKRTIIGVGGDYQFLLELFRIGWPQGFCEKKKERGVRKRNWNDQIENIFTIQLNFWVVQFRWEWSRLSDSFQCPWNKRRKRNKEKRRKRKNYKKT